MTMPSDERIDAIYDRLVMINSNGYDLECTRAHIRLIISAAVEAERKKWVGICDGFNAYDIAEEIKRRGLE